MGELFKAIAHAIREREPVAVVTEVQGPNPGAKMLVGEETVSGSLGDEKLDSAVIENARRIGYGCMRLDTLPHLEAALSLYKSLGFQEIPPYHDYPMRAVFMELMLAKNI